LKQAAQDQREYLVQRPRVLLRSRFRPLRIKPLGPRAARPAWKRSNGRRMYQADGENAFGDIGPVPESSIDPWRPAVSARCLDQVAQAVNRISEIACEINLRNRRR